MYQNDSGEISLQKNLIVFHVSLFFHTRHHSDMVMLPYLAWSLLTTVTPDIQRFQKIERLLTFPGHRRLSRAARDNLINWPVLVDDDLRLMILKQQLHEGDRSHPSIQELDFNKKNFNYPGWRTEAAMAEMVHGYGRLRHIDQAIGAMRRKQVFHDSQPPNKLTTACSSAASYARFVIQATDERFGLIPVVFSIVPLSYVIMLNTVITL
jgi:hypothetical protein